MPLSSLGPVLGSAHVSTVRLILQYYDRNKDALQVNVLPQETRSRVAFFFFDTTLRLVFGSCLTPTCPSWRQCCSRNT